MLNAVTPPVASGRAGVIRAARRPAARRSLAVRGTGHGEPPVSRRTASGPTSRRRPRTPGGQAKTADEVCRMYSFIASVRRLRCTWTKPVSRVALVGDEEQPGVEPAQPVGAVDEAVAAAQDRRPRVRAGWPGRRATSAGSAGSPSTCAVKSTGSNSRRWPSGRADALGPADRLLLLVERSTCPRARSASGSAGRPGRSRRRSQSAPLSPSPTQTNRSSAASFSALRLFVPSLKPNRLRGVAWPVLVEDVRPKPSCDQRTLTTPTPEPDQVADGVRQRRPEPRRVWRGCTRTVV